MQDQAHVVIIIGGVVGASILYHLSKLGCSDAIMLERSELTSGSTWHAAGGIHTINGNPNLANPQQYTIELYKEIENFSGQDISLHMTGSIMLAATEERFGWLKSVRAKGKYLGMETGLDKFVAYCKPADFVGKAGALAERERGGAMRLCSFMIEAKDADVLGDEPISYNGRFVGWVTSGGYAHAAGQSIAQEYMPKEITHEATGWSIELLGEKLAAKRQKFPLFDAYCSRMRS